MAGILVPKVTYEHTAEPEDLRVAHSSKEAECRMSQGTVCHILQTIWKYNKIISFPKNKILYSRIINHFVCIIVSVCVKYISHFCCFMLLFRIFNSSSLVD